MTTIVEGMTPAEFIIAMNSNFADIVAGYVTIAETMTGIELQEALNSNYSDSDTYIGSGFINKLNSNFVTYDVSLTAPSEITLTWIDDYARISFTDNTEGEAKHEIWERQTWKNTTGDVVEDYVLRQILNEGVETVNLKTWQNSVLDYRIRAVKEDQYSNYSVKETINTPQFVFRTDQSTLTRITIKRMLANATAGYGDNNIDWGDGNDNDYSGEDEDVIYHDYSTEGIYFIRITGAQIRYFEFYEQKLDGTDITYWQLPCSANGFFCHFWYNGFVGALDNWHPPYNLEGVHLIGNNLTSSCLDYLFSGNYTLFWDCHLNTHYINASNCGDLISRVPKMAHLNITIIGDISSFKYSKNNDYRSWMCQCGISDAFGDISYLFDGTYQYLHTISLRLNKNISGDLSSWFIGADYSSSTTVNLQGNNLTKLPKGNYFKMSVYNCQANNCNQAEIDAILADIDANVTANAPLYDCTYFLNGAGMGIPSATGLAAKASIEGKYTAAGKTATITVNS
jgi:hypothetical protein